MRIETADFEQTSVRAIESTGRDSIIQRIHSSLS